MLHQLDRCGPLRDIEPFLSVWLRLMQQANKPRV
jgi:hypothetical protein